MKTSYVALLLLPLAGCVSFGGKPPKQLLTLSSTSAVAVGVTRTAGAGQTVTILSPSAPAAILAPRVPVYSGSVAIAYVKDAAWVDSPARLFQRLLSETVAAKTGRIVLDLRQYTTDPGLRVQGTLLMFGIDERRSEAVVTYDAVIARDKGALDSRRFEARVPVGVIDATTVGPALNEAANKVAADVADWIK
jgi:cholesterol transport system auxiliary component